MIHTGFALPEYVYEELRKKAKRLTKKHQKNISVSELMRRAIIKHYNIKLPTKTKE